MMSTTHRTGKVITLVVTCLGLFMVFLDGSIVNVALATIQTDLHAQLSDLQWVVDAFTLPFAALMLTAGTLADRFGRKLRSQRLSRRKRKEAI
jgi:DHA2 family methylenomycin A resistance protein-like MFS transporter